MRYLIALMLVCIMASPVDAKLFGRLRNRQGVATKSKQAFPPGTPPAALDDIKAAMDQLNCPDGTCQRQFAPTTNLQLAVPAIAPVLPTQQQMSIVVQELAVVTPTIASVESDITILKQQVAEKEASLARLRLEQTRTAAIEAIQQRAENQMKWLSIEHTIQDLQAELPAEGGDYKDVNESQD